jgi:hypothetical protein
MGDVVGRRRFVQRLALASGGSLLGLALPESATASVPRAVPAAAHPSALSRANQAEPGQVGPCKDGYWRGINVAPNNGPKAAPDPETLKQYGINAVRLVSRPPDENDDEDADRYAERCQKAGLYVLAVITSESDDFVIKHFDALQIGNEPDGGGHASWKLTPKQYVAKWDYFRQLYPAPQYTLITAGLLRPNSDWNWSSVVRDLTPPVDGIARHSYGDPNGPPRTPDQLSVVLSDFRRQGRGDLPDDHWINTVPLYVTEWHPLPNAIAYIPGLAAVMANEAAGDFFYCWSDRQTPANTETGQAARGLVLDDGATPKEEFQYYVQAPCNPGLRPLTDE